MLLPGSSARIRHVSEGRWGKTRESLPKVLGDSEYALVVSIVDRLVYTNLVVKTSEGWVCNIEAFCVMLTPCFLIRYYHNSFYDDWEMDTRLLTKMIGIMVEGRK